ncbi:MAG TPA: YfhO family protein [Tepidisphaeraceae bacterium]|nr:YfhO family protein [Tepidisphaeraceae bacterium]
MNELTQAAKHSIARELLAICIMLLGVFATYWRPKPAHDAQLASDYNMLHTYRMRYAREALFGAEHFLPAWYSRELMGTPFWSNVQNFPFLPTRLLILALDPDGAYAYTVGITLAALLTALFTYLYCRRVGLGMNGSASAGWTFACCGYFASRIAAGHLPLLEVYCGLPLLLWLVESLVQAMESGAGASRWIVATALCSGCLLLAGHPQLPVYSLATATIYGFWRGGWRRGLLSVQTIALGAGCAAFILVPMAMLVGRSTRVLHLAPADNDLAMPLERLAGFFLPWLDGAAPPLDLAATNRFHGYPSAAYFWDTFVYAGWIPWLAALCLLQLVLFRRVNPRSNKAATFVLLLGVLGLLLSSQPAQNVTSFLPGTFLRSPARLLYLTEFALALALAKVVDLSIRDGLPQWTRWTMPLILLLHFYDVWATDQVFLLHRPAEFDPEPSGVKQLAELIGDGRIGIDFNLSLPSNRTVDDVGFFDSIMLAKPYRWMIDYGRLDARLNVQHMFSGQVPSQVLEAAGVKAVITTSTRPDLQLITDGGRLKAYVTRSPARRADLFPLDRVHFIPIERIHELLRDPQADTGGVLLFPSEYQAVLSLQGTDVVDTTVTYRRPDSDHIECTVQTARPGYLRIIESWDPGWSATVDGSPVNIAPAMDAFLAVPVSAGTHEVRFVYHTPGAMAGAGVSIISIGLLALYAWKLHRAPAGKPDSLAAGAAAR